MKMQSEDFVNLMTVVTSVFCSHMPCGLGKAGRQSPMPLAPVLPELPPGLPSTGYSQLSLAALLPSHAKITLRLRFQQVINKKRGEASWMELPGTTPSWAKPAFKLAFFLTTISNSAIFTDGVSQSLLGSRRLLKGLSGVFNPQSWSGKSTEHLEWARCLLQKYCFSQQSKKTDFSFNRLEQSGLKQLSVLTVYSCRGRSLTCSDPLPGLLTFPPGHMPPQATPLAVDSNHSYKQQSFGKRLSNVHPWAQPQRFWISTAYVCLYLYIYIHIIPLSISLKQGFFILAQLTFRAG